MFSKRPAVAVCALLGLPLAGCGADGLREGALPPAALASSPAPKARYAPVMAGYQHHQPVAPVNWQELNRRVAPPGALPPAQTGPARRERRP